MDSRQVRRQYARLAAKGYQAFPRYVPTRTGRPKLEWVKTGLTMAKVVTGWISPKDYPRQSTRQAARYARQTA